MKFLEWRWRWSGKLGFSWLKVYDCSILRPKFSTSFCSTRMDKHAVCDCCGCPSVTLVGRHSCPVLPLSCQQRKVVWAPKPPCSLILGSTALQMAIKNHEADCSETSRGKREIFNPFVCWISQTQDGNRGDPWALLSILILWRYLSATKTTSQW